MGHDHACTRVASDADTPAWHIVPLGDRLYRIRSQDTKEYLNVVPDYSNPGVQQSSVITERSPCSWLLVPTGEHEYSIMHSGNSQYLDEWHNSVSLQRQQAEAGMACCCPSSPGGQPVKFKSEANPVCTREKRDLANEDVRWVVTFHELLEDQRLNVDSWVVQPDDQDVETTFKVDGDGGLNVANVMKEPAARDETPSPQSPRSPKSPKIGQSLKKNIRNKRAMSHSGV